MGAEYIKAVGIAVGMWRLADSIRHVGDAVKEGMQGHMSVENAGRQIGQEAFKTFKKLDHHHHMGNPEMSWWERLFKK